MPWIELVVDSYFPLSLSQKTTVNSSELQPIERVRGWLMLFQVLDHDKHWTIRLRQSDTLRRIPKRNVEGLSVLPRRLRTVRPAANMGKYQADNSACDDMRDYLEAFAIFILARSLRAPITLVYLQIYSHKHCSIWQSGSQLDHYALK